MKKNYNAFLTMVIIVIAIVVACVILYQKTDWFKRVIAWFAWAYNGLKTFHWGEFVYP